MLVQTPTLKIKLLSLNSKNRLESFKTNFPKSSGNKRWTKELDRKDKKKEITSILKHQKIRDQTTQNKPVEIQAINSEEAFNFRKVIFPSAHQTDQNSKSTKATYRKRSVFKSRNKKWLTICVNSRY